ncbi:DUF302 domain-containing protein [Haloplasma contractile]|uniref:DUF302 domain-containing protein n=1 Tax=Haloplasma contractile SSD-17B TaxID=1033810 RepID=F7PRH6_9MOLU|nr:DUF302 domain-containing protein [Haloplasma contractile]ERJ11698.1 hypothetical protein HLPCO_002181 [Haloplasma contractile SSD-17B]
MKHIFFEMESNHSFDEAVENVTNQLAERGFSVLWKLNMKDKLQDKGYDFEKNFMILEVCNPSQANEVLSRHITVGYFLPCKIVVYEEDAAVKVGFADPKQLIGMLGYKDLKEIAEEVTDVMEKSVRASVE